MTIQFTKMHGLGNDFVVIDTLHQRLELSREQMRAIADRHFGVGCDQILLVAPATNPPALFRYRIFNADGGEVEQCGNGARCFARFVHDKGLTQAREIPVETAAGLIRLYLEDDGQVRVDMGVPRLTPQEIPLRAPARADQYELDIAGRTYRLGAVSMGNPHAVLRVEDVAHAPVHELGARIESHPDFPRRVNVGFMQVVNPAHIRLRVYERGVGETLACGTGACAAVVVGRMQGLLGPMVTVSLPGGDLIIRWVGEGQPVWMSGPAVSVFEGELPEPIRLPADDWRAGDAGVS